MFKIMRSVVQNGNLVYADGVQSDFGLQRPFLFPEMMKSTMKSQ